MTNSPSGLLEVRISSSNGSLAYDQAPVGAQHDSTTNIIYDHLPGKINYDHSRHQRLLNHFSIEAAHPVLYATFTSQEEPSISVNSSNNTTISFKKYYDNILDQLDRLSESEDGEPEVEAAAVNSAKYITYYLRHKQHPPPALSWHGGDAVVMIWSISEVTYAVTVTDGEFGYVVRCNKKLIKYEDSRPIKSFKLLEHD